MRKGKCASQAAHSSLGVILSMMEHMSVSRIDGSEWEEKHLILEKGSPLESWINGRFTKITVRVDSEEELLDIESKAKEAGLPVKLITDAGLTEFNGVPTKTCLAIGPAWEDDINKITGDLKLL